jgi:hypothetical protein
MLAAQLVPLHYSPLAAVATALELYEAARLELEGISLRTQLETPEAQAAWEKQRTGYLDSLKIPYKVGAKTITSKKRRDRAHNWFKKLLKAKAEKERAPKECEAWVTAQLSNYEINGFTGTEVIKLRAEFEQWRWPKKVNKAA